MNHPHSPTMSPSHSTAFPGSAFDEHTVDRFGFGRNWLDYQTSIDHSRLLAARADIEQWLGTASLAGQRVLDIGSGSGVHSYCMHAMGARELVSFDFDAHSVQATAALHARAGSPHSWTVRHGSVLDADFLASLGTFDIVYSWGVLHHTGQLWQAIRNAATRVAQHGIMFFSIYAKGPEYADHLALKQRYHRASLSGKRKMEFDWIRERYDLRAQRGEVPDAWWTDGRERGMDAYCDLVDWLGGLPYEVATLPELVTALHALGIETVRSRECPGDGGCHIVIGKRRSACQAPVVISEPSRANPLRRRG
jgi:2-polyprenyl-3-methyl-5-hydroxy-6-metoxy-1,4-benzoquinol methylase